MYGNETPIGEVLIKGGPSYAKCNEINISFNEYYNSSAMQITVRAKKLADGGNLTASVEGRESSFSGECDLPEPGSITEEVSCEIENTDPQRDYYSVCVYSTGLDVNYYQIPRIHTSEDLFFISAKKGEYQTLLQGKNTITGDNIIEALNNYYDTCEDTCVVPIKLQKTNGEVELSNLYIEDEQGRLVESFSEVARREKELVVNRNVELSLQKFPNLKTPTKKDDYTLKILFKGASAQTFFTVMSVPYASIKTPRTIVAEGESLAFDASKSTSPNGEILLYTWNFGDNTTGNGAQVSHSFSNLGEYRVQLKIEDDAGIQTTTSLTIEVIDLESRLKEILDEVNQQINQSSTLMRVNPLIEDTATLLGYKQKVEQAKLNITSKILDYNSINTSDMNEAIKQNRYLEILDAVEQMKKEIPTKFTVKQSIFQNLLLKKEEMPDVGIFKQFASPDEKTLYEISSFDFNANHVTTNLDAREVNLVLLSGDAQQFVLIKKDIKVQGGENNLLVEDARNLVSYGEDLELLTPDGTIENRVMTWRIQGQKQILYKAKNAILTDAKNAITVVFSDIKLPSLQQPTVEVECGNNICEFNEEFNIDEENPDNQYYCKKDCTQQFPLWIGIVLGLILIIGIFFFDFYRGPGSLKRKAPATKATLSSADMIRLRAYIQEARMNGFAKVDIVKALQEKGWQQKYIDEGCKGIKFEEKQKAL